MRKKLIVLGLFVLLLVAPGCVRRVVVYEQTPVPPPKVEVITIKPYPTAVWAPGVWVWRGKYRGHVWVPGHWRRP